MIAPSSTISPPDQVESDRFGRLYESIAIQERRVLSLMLTYRRIADRIVAASGLMLCHFMHRDHQIIFTGWVMACELDWDRPFMLHMMRLHLQSEDLWNDSARADSVGMFHSDATLVRMCNASTVAEEMSSDGDGLRRMIARHVVSLMEAAEALGLPGCEVVPQ